MTSLLWLLILFGVVGPGVPAGTSANHSRHEECPVTGHKPGSYSALAVDLCFQDVERENRYLEIPSPDHSTTLVIKGSTRAVFRTEGHEDPASLLIGRSQEEVIWSPDSKALLVTLTLGSSGAVSADVVFVQHDPFTQGWSITDSIRKDFVAGHTGDRCREWANVGGLTWLEGGKKAVFVAEVPPSPHCKDGGYFDAYVVSIPEGRILTRYPMKEAIKRWRNVLGPELRNDIDLLKDK